MKKSDDIDYDPFKIWFDEDLSIPDNLTESTEEAIILFAEAHAMTPPHYLKGSILEQIKLLQDTDHIWQVLDINSLPLLSSDSNYLDWSNCVQHISPPDDFGNSFLHPLESTPHRDLFIAWVREYIEEEVHHDILESFIILEGSCECNIINAKGETKIVRLVAGDYIEIPVGESHNIMITSHQPVKAILQWKKVA